MASNNNKINKSTSLGIPSIFFKNKGILNFNQLTVIPKSNDYKSKEQFFNTRKSSIYSEKMNYRIRRTVLGNQRENTEQQIKLYNIENKKRKINESEERNSTKKLCVKDNELNLNQNKSFRTDSIIRKDIFANLDFNRSIDKEFILRDEGFLQNPRLFENSLPTKGINMEVVEKNKVNSSENKHLEIVHKSFEEHIPDDKVINLNLTTNIQSPAINYKTKSINQLLSQIDNHRLTFSKKSYNLSSCTIYQKRFEDIKVLLSNGVCNKEYKEITNETSSRAYSNTYLGETINSNSKYGVNSQTFDVEKLKSITENKSNNVSNVINISENKQNESSLKMESKENFNNNSIRISKNSFETNEPKLNANITDSQKAANLNNPNSYISALNNSKIANLKEPNVKFEFPLKSSNSISFDNSIKSDSVKIISEENKNCKDIDNLPNNFSLGNNSNSVNRKNDLEVGNQSSLNKFPLANPLNNTSSNLSTSNMFGNLSKTELSQIPSSNLEMENTGSNLGQSQILFSYSNSRASNNTQSGSLNNFTIEKTESFHKDNSVLNSNKTDGVKSSLNNFPIKTCSSEVFSFQKNDSNSSKITDFKLNLPTTSESPNSISIISLKQLKPGSNNNLDLGQSKILIFEHKKLQEPVRIPATPINKIVLETNNQGITDKNSFSFGTSNSVFGQTTNKSHNKQQEEVGASNSVFGQPANISENKKQEASDNFSFGASNSNSNSIFGQPTNKLENKQQEASNNFAFGASNAVFGQPANKSENKQQEASNNFSFGASNSVFGQTTNKSENKQQEASNNFSFSAGNSNSNSVFGQPANKSENKQQEASNNFAFGAGNSNSSSVFGQTANKSENKQQEASNNFAFGGSNSVFGQTTNKSENKQQEASKNFSFGAGNSNSSSVFGQTANKSENKQQEASNNFAFGTSSSNSNLVFGQSSKKSENKEHEFKNNFSFGKSNSDDQQQLFRVEKVTTNTKAITNKGSLNNFSFGADNSNSNMVFGQSSNKSENKQHEVSNNFAFGQRDSNTQQLFRVEPQVKTSNVFCTGKSVSNNEQVKSEPATFLNTLSSCKNDSNANVFSQSNNQPTTIFKNQNATNVSSVITSQNNCNDSSFKNIFSKTTMPTSLSFGNKPGNENSDLSKNAFNFNFTKKK